MTAAAATADTRAPSTGHQLTGTGTLVRHALRRDRVRLLAWIGGIAAFTLASAGSLPGLYPAAAERQARATLMQNPGTRAISGPGFGLDDYTFGAMISHEFLSWIAIFVALMAIFAVVRHTRLEEETGRAELVRSSPVGRHAVLAAGVTVATAASVGVGAAVAVGLGSLGLTSVGWGSSVLFGAALATVGLVFAAGAAVTAQLNEHSRGASGLAGAAFALAYLLRAAGDMAEVGGGPLSWLSPIGWAQQTRVYVDDRWWPLLLPLGLAAILAAVAYRLNAHRDVGVGLVRPRRGPAHAAPTLSDPLGLAWRLQRASVLWWSVGMFVGAVGYGGLASEVERFVAEMSVLQEAMAAIGGTILDAWLAVIILVLAVVATVFAVLTALRARSEEESGRAEPVLATAVSRTRWLASHLVVAVIGGATLMFLAGLGLGISAALALGDGAMLGRVLGAALSHVPAIWLVTGLGVALYGLAPRASRLVWVVIAYAGFVGWLGALLRFPQWALNLSPLGHTPLVPAEDPRWLPLVVMVALAAALMAAGMAAFRRRDLHGTA